MVAKDFVDPSQYFVGVSMRGMQAFEWAVRYPDFAHKTAAIIGIPRLPAFDVALWGNPQ
ncbi:MAG: homoserine acetyltransferase [Alphaproteobacteria bacterium]|jgi:homoserine acetyltransferase